MTKIELPPSINSILAAYGVHNEDLERTLVAREDALADLLRIAGRDFGAMPEFVAKVLMDIGIGTPVDQETQRYLNQQFADRLEWLQQEYRRQHGDDQ